MYYSWILHIWRAWKGLRLRIPRLSHRFVFTNVRHFTHNDVALCAKTLAFARYTLSGPSFRLNSTPADDAVIHKAFTRCGIRVKLRGRGTAEERRAFVNQIHPLDFISWLYHTRNSTNMTTREIGRCLLRESKIFKK